MSENFRQLAKSTQRSYVALIKRIEAKFGTFPLSAMTDRRTRGVFMAWRDELAIDSGRRQADYAWSVLALILAWALTAGLWRPIPAKKAAGFIEDHGPTKSGPPMMKQLS